MVTTRQGVPLVTSRIIPLHPYESSARRTELESFPSSRNGGSPGRAQCTGRRRGGIGIQIYLTPELCWEEPVSAGHVTLPGARNSWPRGRGEPAGLGGKTAHFQAHFLPQESPRGHYQVQNERESAWDFSFSSIEMAIIATTCEVSVSAKC